MKPVIQEDVTGCGIAAVAALAGVSYRRARQRAARLGIDPADRTLWSDTAYVRRLLAAYGLRALPGEQPFSGWQGLPERGLLAIKWHRENGKPFWHWVYLSATVRRRLCWIQSA